LPYPVVVVHDIHEYIRNPLGTGYEKIEYAHEGALVNQRTSRVPMAGSNVGLPVGTKVAGTQFQIIVAGE